MNTAERISSLLVERARQIAEELPVGIPWERAVLCAGCETVHNQPGGACPRCTSRHGISLPQLLQRRAS